MNGKQKEALGEIRTFVRSDLVFPQPRREDRPTGRVYVTPDGNVYPSATTILGAVGDKSWLDAWRDRIGHDEAHKITYQSGRRGTELHSIIERYIGNDPKYLDGKISPVYYDLFRQVKPRIDESLGTIYGIEVGLYSDYLRASGTADLVALWDGELSLVDWKNARRFKSIEDIHGYFHQTCMYSIMFEERTGRVVKNLVIVMAVEGNTGAAVVFKVPRTDWDRSTLDIVKAYHALSKN